MWFITFKTSVPINHPITHTWYYSWSSVQEETLKFFVSYIIDMWNKIHRVSLNWKKRSEFKKDMTPWICSTDIQ